MFLGRRNHQGKGPDYCAAQTPHKVCVYAVVKNICMLQDLVREQDKIMTEEIVVLCWLYLLITDPLIFLLDCCPLVGLLLSWFVIEMVRC